MPGGCSEEVNAIQSNMWVGPSSCNNGACSATFPNALAPGRNWWWLNVWYGDVVCGIVSQPGGKFKEFTVEGCAGPTLTSPDGAALALYTKPTFTFSDSGAEWYNIQLWTSSGFIALNQWEDAMSACNGTTCTVVSTNYFGNGSTNWWWVNTWSPACGYQVQPGGGVKSFTVQ